VIVSPVTIGHKEELREQVLLGLRRHNNRDETGVSGTDVLTLHLGWGIQILKFTLYPLSSMHYKTFNRTLLRLCAMLNQEFSDLIPLCAFPVYTFMHSGFNNIGFETAEHNFKTEKNVRFLFDQVVEDQWVFIFSGLGEWVVKSFFKTFGIVNHDFGELVLITGLQNRQNNLVHNSPSQIVIDASVSVIVKELIEKLFYYIFEGGYSLFINQLSYNKVQSSLKMWFKGCMRLSYDTINQTQDLLKNVNNHISYLKILRKQK